ncbi:MAG: divalent metal cation transporter, partial [Oscillospiraceae bacterium]
NMPKSVSWIFLVAVSVPLSLMYGSGENQKGVRFVENAMKVMIGIMLVVFGAVLCVTGINFPAMIKGLLIPTLPSGMDGIIMLIGSLTATIGVMDWVLFNNGMISRGYSEEHETLGRFDAFFGGLLPVTLILSFVSMAFAEAFEGNPSIPETTQELCDALVGIIPSVWIQLGFYIGIIALVISSMIGLSITCATSFYQSTSVPKNPKAWYHPFIVLAPQIGFLGAFFGKPVLIVVTVAAMQSVFNWISGNSWYLLANDPRFLGKKVVQSRFFNFGILVCISILNIVFITFIMSKLGAWPA